MDNVNNSTKGIAESTEPHGLRFLKSHPRTEEEALQALSLCCQNHPFGCDFQKQCARRYDIESESWRHYEKVDYKPPRQTVGAKYANWLGQLHRQTVVSRIRERPIY